MNDSLELAEIRARVERKYNDGASDNYEQAESDRSTLLRMLNDAHTAFDALNLVTRESADQLRRERDAARAKVDLLRMQLGVAES